MSIELGFWLCKTIYSAMIVSVMLKGMCLGKGSRERARDRRNASLQGDKNEMFWRYDFYFEKTHCESRWCIENGLMCVELDADLRRTCRILCRLRGVRKLPTGVFWIH